MPSVYLAGPIKGLSYADSTDWRDFVCQMLPQAITPLSPMRYKQYLNAEHSLDDAYEHPLSTAQGIVARDRFDVMRCDMVLAFLAGAPVASIGTMIEFGWADAYRKPIVAVMTAQDVHWHAMVRELSGFVVEDLKSAMDIIAAILLPER
ncbi:nucleoside 2-deoxyribosyltransferase [Aggregatilinea lenta]|uniref:nucleoside 2-deoxyribosyltransferase n=1 Tax=Aggregatilinea lenta TaxID=913108 RepID=UPI000E5BA94A|nr:nucleoside 2-deoxyribosyltransferase [Aggregatilinea lenta]